MREQEMLHIIPGWVTMCMHVGRLQPLDDRIGWGWDVHLHIDLEYGGGGGGGRRETKQGRRGGVCRTV